MHVSVHACARVYCMCLRICTNLVLTCSNIVTVQEVDNYETNLTMWVESLQHTSEDKGSLDNGEWLNANHMFAASVLLKRAFPQQNGLCDTSYLAKKFCWPSVPEGFVQIIHVGRGHWACLSNVLCEDNVVEFFDSLHCDPELETSITVQASSILQCESPSFAIRVVNVQKQENSDTCGLFAIAMAFDLCDGKDPFLSTYHETAMRSHLQECFTQETMSQFPCGSGSRRKKRVIKEVHVDLFCVCRYPDIDVTSHLGNMACCSKCQQWYHEKCVNIPTKVLQNPKVKWLCSI